MGSKKILVVTRTQSVLTIYNNHTRTPWLANGGTATLLVFTQSDNHWYFRPKNSLAFWIHHSILVSPTHFDLNRRIIAVPREVASPYLLKIRCLSKHPPSTPPYFGNDALRFSLEVKFIGACRLCFGSGH